MDWTTFYTQQGGSTGSHGNRAEDWQVQLAALISRLAPATSLEAGSGLGVTSLLLDGAHCRRYMLDREFPALCGARQTFALHGEKAECIGGDLFCLPFADRTFDVVFNSGVLEHFGYTGRRKAVAEMLRVAKPSGTVLIGLPNHYSYPYRYSYLYRTRRNQWPYPAENRIYDLTREIGDLGIRVTQQRETVDRRTALHFLRRHQRILFRLLGLLRPYEGYLTVLTLTRE